MSLERDSRRTDLAVESSSRTAAQTRIDMSRVEIARNKALKPMFLILVLKIR